MAWGAHTGWDSPWPGVADGTAGGGCVAGVAGGTAAGGCVAGGTAVGECAAGGGCVGVVVGIVVDVFVCVVVRVVDATAAVVGGGWSEQRRKGRAEEARGRRL
jgi:hypothetical protein